MKNFICHLFTPRESNNHRAKILHHKSLIIVIVALVFGQFFITAVKSKYPGVLGITADISSQQLLLLTNQKRQEQNLPPVVLNDQLSQAALLKAQDMFAQNFWAHNAPDGTTPWFYFKKKGYEYAYAGENLARGFTSPESVINAWMASPTHRDNMLSSRYKDIGFAIVAGKLLGEETILVVELLGSKNTEMLARENVNKPITTSSTTLVKPQAFAVSNSLIGKSNLTSTLSIKATPVIDLGALSRNMSLAVVLIFIFVLILDMIVVERKKITRLVGHNLDHALFLGAILLFVLLFVRGVII